jgi:hypothetical protein
LGPLNLGLNFAFPNSVDLALLYTWYADNATWNPTHDRDFSAASSVCRSNVDAVSRPRNHLLTNRPRREHENRL